MRVGFVVAAAEAALGRGKEGGRLGGLDDEVEDWESTEVCPIDGPP